MASQDINTIRPSPSTLADSVFDITDSVITALNYTMNPVMWLV